MAQYSDNQVICVRVFLSSTFRGLVGVRDYLRKHVFPEIELEYRKRGIGLSLVDLQWGVTEEEAREGKTVELCLREIERCQPYFLGLVGVRSGWRPTPEDCVFHTKRIAQFFNDHPGRTITELEFLYNHFTMANPADAGILYLGEELDDDYGSPQAPSLASSQTAATAARELVEETYGPQQFEERIRSLDDLAHAVRELLMKRLEALTEGERFDRRQSSIRRNKNRQALLHSNGFCREADLKNILSLAHCRDKSVILVTGPSGSGKSTILTCLYEALRTSGQTVFVRFQQDAILSPQDLWESIGAEAGYDPPEDSWKRASASSGLAYLMKWFIKRKKPVVLLIDDIDAYPMPVSSRKDFLDECMNILPDEVKLILTARDGAFDSEKHPEVCFYKLPALETDAKRRALSDLELVFGKRFGHEVERIILASEKCRNPEYLMWLVKYLQENAVFENLTELAETAERTYSLDMLIQRVLGISLRNTNGVAERLYTCLALVPEGLTEQELKRLFPKVPFRVICMALGKLGSAIQYDQEGRIHLVNKTLIRLLLHAGNLTEYTAAFLDKRLLPVLADTDAKRHALIYTRQKLRSGKFGKLFSRMARPTFCEAIAEDRELWNRALEEAYQNDKLGHVIKRLSLCHQPDIHLYLYVMDWFSNFLEDKGEYNAAIWIQKRIEAFLCESIGPFHYGTGTVYANLLVLYSKNRDFDMAELILRHIGFILKENIDAGRLPPDSDYLRLNFGEAFAVYSQLCPDSKEGITDRILRLAEMMDGCNYIIKNRPVPAPVNRLDLRRNIEPTDEHYVIGQLIQPEDYLTAYENGGLHLTREELFYIKFEFVGNFQLHNLPGALCRGNKTEQLSIREYNCLMDCRRYFRMPRRGPLSSRHVVSVGKELDLDVYLALSDCCPKRMGCAYGYDGEQYLIYGYQDTCRLDEAAYLFWLLSDGTTTVEEIARRIQGMFKAPDNYMILKETGQSIRLLYHRFLIWFDEKCEEGEHS